jgi:hypothetical protein
MGNRRLGHAWIRGLLRILRQDQPAALSDRDRTSGAVIKGARQHDGDNPWAARAGAASKQHIDSRAVAVSRGP